MITISYQRGRHYYVKGTKTKVNLSFIKLLIRENSKFQIIASSGKNVTREILFKLLKETEKQINSPDGIGSSNCFKMINNLKERLYDTTNENYVS